MDKKKKRIAQWLPLLFAALFLPFAAACDKDSEKEKEPPAPPVEFGAEVVDFKCSYQENTNWERRNMVCVVDYNAESGKLTIAVDNFGCFFRNPIADATYIFQNSGNVLQLMPLVRIASSDEDGSYKYFCSARWEIEIAAPGEYAVYLGNLLGYSKDSEIEEIKHAYFRLLLPLKLDLTKDLHSVINGEQGGFRYEYF